MQQPVTPYIWTYKPETGTAAGARQDYGSVINWLRASPQLCQRIREVNNFRNYIDKTRSHLSDEMTCYFNAWPANVVSQPEGTPYRPAPNPVLGQHSIHDFLSTAEGSQIAGGLISSPDISGHGANALSSYPTLKYVNVDSPILSYRHPGQQLQGGSITSKNDNFLLSEESRVPRSGGLSPLQFLQEFPPIVYNNPFSENMLYFPKEFSPLFEPEKDHRRTSLFSLKYQ